MPRMSRWPSPKRNEHGDTAAAKSGQWADIVAGAPVTMLTEGLLTSPWK